jgi:uncharacterized protein with HEPN domain
MKGRISLIHDLWREVDLADASADQTRWAAFERHLEVISEASRALPEDWKHQHGGAVPWPKVAGLGNLLRHVYQHLDGRILWDIYLNDLGPLEAAIDRMIAACATPPRSPSS